MNIPKNLKPVLKRLVENGLDKEELEKRTWLDTLEKKINYIYLTYCCFVSIFNKELTREFLLRPEVAKIFWGEGKKNTPIYDEKGKCLVEVIYKLHLQQAVFENVINYYYKNL